MQRQGRAMAAAALAFGFASLIAVTPGEAANGGGAPTPSAVAVAAADVAALVYELAEDETHTIVQAPNIGGEVLDLPNGIRAALYTDGDGGYTLAFAGTTEGDLGDLWTDALIGIVPANMFTPAPIFAASQVETALNFAEAARIVVERRGGSADDIVVTGHSLGGALAQIVGATVLAGSQVETFSAPGVGRLIEQLRETDSALSTRMAIADEPGTITNHVRFGDLVTYAGGRHLGLVVTYPSDFPPGPDLGESLSHYLKRAAGQNHNMDRFAAFLATLAAGATADKPVKLPTAPAQPLQCRTIFQDPCHIVGLQLVCDRPTMAQVCE